LREFSTTKRSAIGTDSEEALSGRSVLPNSPNTQATEPVLHY
jgi:hypothetical protein